jgi:hypothetical protein
MTPKKHKMCQTLLLIPLISTAFMCFILVGLDRDINPIKWMSLASVSYFFAVFVLRKFIPAKCPNCSHRLEVKYVVFDSNRSKTVYCCESCNFEKSYTHSRTSS